MTETITTQAGNTTTGNWRVFQSESNSVQRMSKRTKSDVFSDTIVKKFNFLKMVLSNRWLNCSKRSKTTCIKTLWTEWTKRRKQPQLGKNSWLSWTRRTSCWPHGAKASTVRKRLRRDQALRQRKVCSTPSTHWQEQPRLCACHCNKSQSRKEKSASTAKSQPRQECCGEDLIDRLIYLCIDSMFIYVSYLKEKIIKRERYESWIMISCFGFS